MTMVVTRADLKGKSTHHMLGGEYTVGSDFDPAYEVPVKCPRCSDVFYEIEYRVDWNRCCIACTNETLATPRIMVKLVTDRAKVLTCAGCAKSSPMNTEQWYCNISGYRRGEDCDYCGDCGPHMPDIPLSDDLRATIRQDGYNTPIATRTRAKQK